MPESLSLPADLPGVVTLAPEALAQLRALDPKSGSTFVQRVLATYQRTFAASLDTLTAARAAADAAEVLRVVHALKSSSAYIGATGFSGDCAALERALRAHEQAGSLGTALSEPGLMASLERLLVTAAAVREAVDRELVRCTA